MGHNAWVDRRNVQLLDAFVWSNLDDENALKIEERDQKVFRTMQILPK